MQTFLGYEEFFAQRKDRTLWYYKMPLYGHGSPHAVLASDHIAPTRGGALKFEELSFGEPTAMIPLDQYEQTIRSKILSERLTPATGRLGKPYEELEPVVWEIAFYIATFAKNTPAGRVIGAASLLLSLASGQSEGAPGVAVGAVVNFLWAKSLLKVANIKNEWVVELGAEAITQSFPLASNTKKRMSPSVRMLEKIHAFRFHVNREKFMLDMHRLDLKLKKDTRKIPPFR